MYHSVGKRTTHLKILPSYQKNLYAGERGGADLTLSGR